MDLTKILEGKKTYIAAAGLALLAVVTYAAGDPVGAGQYLLQALGFFGLRCAIAQAPPPPAPPTQSPNVPLT